MATNYCSLISIYKFKKWFSLPPIYLVVERFIKINVVWMLLGIIEFISYTLSDEWLFGSGNCDLMFCGCLLLDSIKQVDWFVAAETEGRQRQKAKRMKQLSTQGTNEANESNHKRVSELEIFIAYYWANPMSKFQPKVDYQKLHNGYL